MVVFHFKRGYSPLFFCGRNKAVCFLEAGTAKKHA
jgi:hypothetical protein